MTYIDYLINLIDRIDEDGRDYEGEALDAQRDHEEDMAANEPWL